MSRARPKHFKRPRETLYENVKSRQRYSTQELTIQIEELFRIVSNNPLTLLVRNATTVLG